MKRLLLLSLLFLGSLLNNGFIYKSEPKIKGLICGSELYMQVLRRNFSLDDIYSGEPQNKIALEIENDENEYFYSFYIDIKTGILYKIDQEKSNQFVTYVMPYSNSSNPEVIKKGNLVSYEDFISAVENGEVSSFLFIPGSATAYFLINGVQTYVHLIADKELVNTLFDNNVGFAVKTWSEYEYFSEKKGNKIKISIVEYLSGGEEETYEYYINLSKLTSTRSSTIMFDGQKIIDSCLLFPLPGIINVEN